MPELTGLHAVPPAARWSKQMPIEFLHGRPLSPEELDMIRQQIEEGFDNIAEVDDEIRGIVARNWPYLVEELARPPVRLSKLNAHQTRTGRLHVEYAKSMEELRKFNELNDAFADPLIQAAGKAAAAKEQFDDLVNASAAATETKAPGAAVHTLA
jgi:hypothetical protein